MQMVTIKEIKAFPYSTKLRFPFKTANVINYNMNLVIVEVKTKEGFTKEGFTGYGEGVPAWEVTGETQTSMLSILADYLIPAVMNCEDLTLDSPSDLERICNVFNPTSLSGIPQTVMYNAGAKCALEIALYDVYSKAAKQPLSQLFCNPRQSHCIESVGVVGSDSIEEALSLAKMQIDMGATTLKVKVGVNTKVEIEILKRIRQDYPTLHINLDANQGFPNPQSAIKFMNQCYDQKLDIEFLEQPCYARNLDAFSIIKDATLHTGIRLSADESVQTYYDALNLIESDSVDIINLKLMKHGGYRETLEILKLARKHGVHCKLGSMIENSLGTAANYQFMQGNSDIIEGDLLSFWAYEQSNAEGLHFNNFKLSITDPTGIGVQFLSIYR
jgi:L-alanine-DL-glutamate epimerase-like enolase superfamily enzyme